MHVDEETNERVVKTIWVCDVCQVEEFESYEDAVKHESMCSILTKQRKKKKRKLMNDTFSKNHRNTDNAVAGKSLGVTKSTNKEKEAAGPHKPFGRNHDNDKSKSTTGSSSLPMTTTAPARNFAALDMIIPHPLAKPFLTAGFCQPLGGSCFACDVCHNAYFRTFEEALLHENLCKQQRDRDIALAKHKAMNRHYWVDETPKIILETEHNDKTATFGVAHGLQKKNDVIEVARGEKTRNGSKEQHDWSTLRGIPLPTSPLTKSTLVKPKSINNDSNTMGQEDITGNNVAQLCKMTIGQLLDIKAKPSLLEEGDEVEWDDQRFSQLFKLLHPFYRDALTCINVCTAQDNQDLHAVPGCAMVKMQCIYCSYKIYVTDVNNWQTALSRFVKGHVMESCTSVPDDLKSTLLTQKDKVEKTYDPFHSSLLDKFCECVAMLYNFFNGNSSGSFVASENKSRPDEKESNGSKRRKIVRQKIVKSIAKCKKRKSRQLETLSKEKNAITSADSTSFGGVPLLCSITLAKSKGLTYSQQVLLSQLELRQDGKDEIRQGNGVQPGISLRCLNCHCCIKHLNSKTDLFTDVISAHAHFDTCAFTSDKVACAIRDLGRTKNQSKVDHMEFYCQFLARVYGLCDETSLGGEQHVIFQDSKDRVESCVNNNIALEVKE